MYGPGIPAICRQEDIYGVGTDGGGVRTDHIPGDGLRGAGGENKSGCILAGYLKTLAGIKHIEMDAVIGDQEAPKAVIDIAQGELKGKVAGHIGGLLPFRIFIAGIAEHTGKHHIDAGKYTCHGCCGIIRAENGAGIMGIDQLKTKITKIPLLPAIQDCGI